MTRYIAAAGLLFSLWISGTAVAGTQEIGQLRQLTRRLQEYSQRLATARDSVVVSADQLSARIDSLKGDQSAAQELRDALRSSLILVQHLVAIDRELEDVRTRQDSVRERLRIAYDWEIGQLIQQLNAAPDQGLLAQLVVYQQERESLGAEPVGSELRYGAKMAITSSDGPDEIRQKMELMEDITARLRAEARRTQSKLVRLEKEQRLRTRVQGYSERISLFDGSLPKGRILVHTRAQLVGSLSADLHGSGAAEADRPVVRGALHVVHQDGPRAWRLVGAEDVALEIHKLRAHQQEIRQLEAVARERAASFRACLNKMLEGGE